MENSWKFDWKVLYLNLNPFSKGTHTSSTNITPSHPRAYPIASPNSLGLAANLGQGQSMMMFNTPAWIGPCCHRERRQETLATTFEGFKAVLEHLNPAQKESMATVQLKPKLVAKKWPIHSQPNNLSNLDQNALHVHTDESWSAALMLASMSPRNFSKFFASWATATWQTSDYWQCLLCWGKGFFLAWKLTKGASFMAPGVVDESGDSLSSLEVVS